MNGPDPTHELRLGDASTWDYMCVNCHFTDRVPGGWGKLVHPCPKPVGQGGITVAEWYDERKKQVSESLKS